MAREEYAAGNAAVNIALGERHKIVSWLQRERMRYAELADRTDDEEMSAFYLARSQSFFAALSGVADGKYES